MRDRDGIGLFGSRVGRRVLTMFLLAGLLPMLLMTGLAYVRVTDGLQQDIHVTLRENAKSIGMRIVDNLKELSAAAQLIARAENEGSETLRTVLRTSAGRFDAVWSLSPEGGVQLLEGDRVTRFDAGRIDRRHLAGGRSQLLRAEQGESPEWLLLVAAGYDDRGLRLLVIRLADETLWSPYEYLPHQSEYCIFPDAGSAYFCSEGLTGSGDLPIAEKGFRDATDIIEWNHDEKRMLSASWQLFLMGEAALDSVDVVTAIDRKNIFSIAREFQSIFPLVVALVVALIAYLSFRIVRNNLIPVRLLQNAAADFSSGKLDTRVRIETGDEFEHLGTTFNNMASSLDQQFSLLRAMSNVDRLIMSFAAVDDICEVVLAHLSAQLGDGPCAALLHTDSDATQARLLVWHQKQLDAEHIVFDPRLTQRVRPDVGDDWYGLQDLSAPLRKYYEGAGYRFFRNVPISFGGQARGVVVLGSPSRDDAMEKVVQHCRDLARRIAVGVSNAEREEVLYRKTHYDDLTNLPNRQLLEDRLVQAISQLDRSRQSGALLLLDLDHFKKINDLFGHSTGDLILKRVAERLMNEAPESYTVARLGDDEFAIVMPNIAAAEGAGEFAAALQLRLSQKFDVHGNEHFIGASIGIALFPDDGDNFELLIRNADAALNRVKDAGRGKFEYFSERLNVESRRRLTLERALRTAIEAEELRLHYQPQFEITGGRLHGAEALLRWRHPLMGPISPAEFIPIAEQTDLIVEIGSWVIDRVCRDIRRFRDAGLDCRSISINVSARQLQDHHFAKGVISILDRHGVDPAAIKLEITETAIANNVNAAIDALAQLRNQGVHIAMDDFGTGFSSLSHLNEMPFDYLKIDQSFVRGLGGQRDTDKICRAIITMAHELDKTIIAEGIETEEQEAFLKNYRVQVGQGYLYSKPLPLRDFRKLIEEQPAGRTRGDTLAAV